MGSCQRSEFEPNVRDESQEAKPSTQMLVFSSKDALSASIEMGSGRDSHGRELEKLDSEVRIPLNTESLRATGEELSIPLSELVPESAFARLLNADGELRVADTIYKVSPAGTFFAHIDRYQELREVAEQYTIPSGVEKNTLQTFGEVKLLTTYSEEDLSMMIESARSDREGSHLNSKAEFMISDWDEPHGPASPPPPVQESNINTEVLHPMLTLPSPDVSKFDTARARRRSWMGQRLQDIGFTNAHYKVFPDFSQRRIRAIVFDYNFVIRHSAGVKCTIEKRMWHGGWGTVKNWNEGEIRVGVRNAIVRYRYPGGNTFDPNRILKNLPDRLYAPQSGAYFMPYPKWFKNSIIDLSGISVLKKSHVSVEDVLGMVKPMVKSYAERIGKSLGANGGHRPNNLAYPWEGQNILDPRIYNLNEQEQRWVDRYPIAFPIYTPDYIYVYYTGGWNYNAKGNGEALIRFSDGHGNFSIGVSLHDPMKPKNWKVEPSGFSVDSDPSRADLLEGEFYACGYHNGWIGFKLDW